MRVYTLGSVVIMAALAASATSGASRVKGETGMRGHQTRLSTVSNSFSGHTCAVLQDATVRCWGPNSFGQLGNGATSNYESSPVQAGVYNIASIAAGAYHTCALLGGGGGGGTVQCWGRNDVGQLGNGTLSTQSLTPVGVSSLSSVVEISAGVSHTCALRVNGTVMCWGYNAVGQLGTGNPGGLSDLPLAVQLGGVATSISAGGNHTCAILVGGTVKCWGENINGQLGDNTTTFRAFPVTVQGLTGAVAVAAGWQHSCAILVSGFMSCWGDNLYGELGDSTGIDQHTPVQVSSIGNVVAISAGGFHTCAIHANGQIQCWGDDELGELGDGKTATEYSPATPAAGINNAVEIAAGSLDSCATDSAGTVRCWGGDTSGELGNGTVSSFPNPLPTTVAGISGSISARRIAAGFYSNCARRASGGVSCWGDGADGELGNGLFQSSASAVNVSGMANDIVNVSASLHVCAIHAAGSVSCWGHNSFGQLGNGNTTPSANPVTLSLNNLVQVTTGGDHTCVLVADGTIRCWGLANLGELGSPGVGFMSLTPVAVYAPNGTDLFSGAIAISAGRRHTCAVKYDGTLWCWGDNSYGQLGDGGAESSASLPVQVLGLTNTISVSAGEFHTCAVSAIGTVTCWGANDEGRLGNSTTQPRSVPDGVIGLSDAMAVSAGNTHTCAVHADGSASCWGDDSQWQLAASDTSNHTSPVPVISGLVTVQGVQIPIKLSSVAEIAAGVLHTCALGIAGGISCWGNNSYGQLGNGLTSNSQRPVTVNSFTANVSPAVTLHSNGRIATVTALVNCPAGGEAHISLTLEQGSVSGSGVAVQACANGLVEVPMTIPANGPAAFQPGPATAHVEAVIKNQGQVTNDQHWTRAVTLAFP